MDKRAESNWFKSLKAFEKVSTPLFVIDTKIVRDNVKRFKKLLPDIKLYYAVKALSENQVILAMDDLVDGYDVASIGELKRVKRISKKPILFSNPVKIPSHISGASKVGVKKFAFDSAMELEKIADNSPGSDVYLRLKVSDYGSSFPLSKKFGANEDHAVALFGYANDLGLNPIGITFHVGSQSENMPTWENAIEQAGRVIKRLTNAGFSISMLDIGGGFPGQYYNETISLEDIARVIKAGLKRHIPSNIEVCAEPGRNIVADAAVLLTTVIGRENRSGQSWLYLDVGAFHGLIESLEMDDWKYPVFALNNHDASAMPHHYTLTGPTCDAQDTIDLDVPLPANLKVGDRVCIGSAGAYSIVYASSFNGFDAPKVVYVDRDIMEVKK